MATDQKSNHTVLITGGSSGIGLAIARELGRSGYAVALLARNAARCDSAVHALHDEGIKASALPCDVGDEAGVRSTVATLAETTDLRIVVNAAGVGRFGPIEEINGSTIAEVFRANLLGTILVVSAALPALRAKRHGTIATVLSTAALSGRESESVYCAAKWGARGFMESLKAETKGSGIRTLSIFVGGTRTPFWSADTGLRPAVEQFMDPSFVAEAIAGALLQSYDGYVSEMTILRG